MARLDAYPPADPLIGPEVIALAQAGLDGHRHTRSAPLEYLIALIQIRLAGELGGGGGGGGGPSTDFVFTQSTPQSVWSIVHNQGRYPQVTVVDSAGDEVEADKVYLDANQIRIVFSAPFAGAAYCS